MCEQSIRYHMKVHVCTLECCSIAWQRNKEKLTHPLPSIQAGGTHDLVK